MADPTVNGLLIAAVTSLAGVVTYLWKQLSNHYTELKAEHRECVDDREKLWKALYSIHPACKEVKEL
jgi:hypothetical protein